MPERDDPQEPVPVGGAIELALDGIQARVERSGQIDQLVEMRRLGGFTWQRMADIAGFVSVNAAKLAYSRALHQALDDNDGRTREEVLALELDRLDAIQGEFWAIMRSPDSVPATKITAGLAALKVIAARAKLLGLDVDPTKHTGVTEPLVIIRKETWVEQINEYIKEDEARLEAQRKAKQAPPA